MKCIELARAMLKSRMPEGEPPPLFTAKEQVILEIIEQNKQAAKSYHRMDEA